MRKTPSEKHLIEKHLSEKKIVDTLKKCRTNICNLQQDDKLVLIAILETLQHLSIEETLSHSNQKFEVKKYNFKQEFAELYMKDSGRKNRAEVAYDNYISVDTLINHSRYFINIFDKKLNYLQKNANLCYLCDEKVETIYHQIKKMKHM